MRKPSSYSLSSQRFGLGFLLGLMVASSSLSCLSPTEEPVADFEANIDPLNPLTVHFDASATMSSVAISEYKWNFGDGSPCDASCKADPQPTTTYAKRSVYTITLTVVDLNFGESLPAAKTILIGNKAPQAVLSGPTRAFVDENVSFESQSTDEDGTIEFWEFRFGDEAPGAGPTRLQRPTANHTYTAVGEYTVQLTVIDNDKEESEPDSQQIRIIDEDTVPPTISVQTPSSGDILRGLVQIQATAEDNVDVILVEFLIDGVLQARDDTRGYSFVWDTRQEQNGSHVIRARAIDSSGNSADSRPVTVTVQNP